MNMTEARKNDDVNDDFEISSLSNIDIFETIAPAHTYDRSKINHVKQMEQNRKYQDVIKEAMSESTSPKYEIEELDLNEVNIHNDDEEEEIELYDEPDFSKMYKDEDIIIENPNDDNLEQEEDDDEEEEEEDEEEEEEEELLEEEDEDELLLDDDEDELLEEDDELLEELLDEIALF